MRNRLFCLLTVLVMALLACAPALAWDSSTLYNGCSGNEVKKLQQALINLGFLSGTADGKFGNKTEEAVRRFQKANKLDVDGLAGKMTQEILYAAEKATVSADPAPAAEQTVQEQVVQEASEPVSTTPVETAPAETTPVETAPAENTQASSSSSAVSSSASLFSGNYTSLRKGASGDRVKIMQQALIQLKYLSGKADGKFGKQTQAAVIAFQKKQNLDPDGVAGKKTLTALEKAVSNGTASTASSSSTAETAASAQSAASSSESQSATSAVTVASVSAPGASSIKLLHWYNDIKPNLKNGDHLLIYDPSSGLSWTLRVLSRGRHCDSEPLTKVDTETMLKAFGDKNTWNQKAVYVKLPWGTWTIGSTHDMPHMSGSIKDNGFDGHLCVHFLRDMEEAKKYDPNYGVSNQETIRAFWKKITGQEITN
ncbi:MAG: peptidoglycan-binding protein [Clostridia bacterium]|nr:peptidoglycan-binding protein [Clostridia bacterium]